MKTFTIDDIRALGPCYDPSRYLPEDWTGTALDILKVDACPAEDRLWVVLHKGFIDNKTMRVFAVWCARETLKLVDKPDPRSLAACDVAERYANGQATKEELEAAAAEARAAARAAATVVAARTATAATAAAWAAAWAAAATENAARGAAEARAAARAAATVVAARTATATAWAAAAAEARDAQVAQMIKLIEQEETQKMIIVLIYCMFACAALGAGTFYLSGFAWYWGALLGALIGLIAGLTIAGLCNAAARMDRE